VDAERRHWIEVSKRGQVVGVIERTSNGDSMLPVSIEDLAAMFADAEVLNISDFPSEFLPKATVVVPTIYQRIELLTKTVQALLNLDYPDYEIIVVDNRVGDDLVPIVPFTDDERVTIVVERNPGTSAARNCGVKESRGDIVAFTDDDVEVDRMWLRALCVALARDQGIGVVGGMVRALELDTEPQLWFEEFYGGFTRSYQAKEWNLGMDQADDPLFPYSPGHFGAGCNLAIRRSTFDRVGGFDLRLGPGTPSYGAEDLKLMLDVLFSGEKVAYVPSALVRHSHRRTVPQFKKQVFGYGVGFTSLLTALVFDDRRHFFEILKRIPRGARMLLRPSVRPSPSAITSFPRWIQLIQLTGMAYGPIGFARSAMRRRRSMRHQPHSR
jgi:GT2 family glycosyltransferase